MEKLDRLGWAVNRTYAIGSLMFGVRTNSEACGRWLDQTLGRYGLAGEAGPYLSLWVGENGGPARKYHLLYQESQEIMRSFDPAAIGDTFLQKIESLKFNEREDAFYAAVGFVQTTDGRIGLVPSMISNIIRPYHRELERAGLTVSLANELAFDRTTGELVSVQRQLGYPEDAADRLREVAKSNGRDPRLDVPLPARVDLVCSVGMTEEPVKRVGPAVAAYRLGSHAMNLRTTGGAVMDTVKQIVEGAHCFELPAVHTRKGLLESLALAFETARAAP